MARWKACVRLPIRRNWTLFASSYRSGATRQNMSTRCYQEVVGHLEPRFQGKESSVGNFFLVSTKLDTFCYLTVQTAPWYVPSFWHNTGVCRTDRRTDGRNCSGYNSACKAAPCKNWLRSVQYSPDSAEENKILHFENFRLPVLYAAITYLQFLPHDALYSAVCATSSVCPYVRLSHLRMTVVCEIFPHRPNTNKLLSINISARCLWF